MPFQNHLRFTRLATGLLTIVLVTLTVNAHAAEQPRSKRIRTVLRQPLPSEDLKYEVNSAGINIEGPTFRYTIDKQSGVIRGLEVKREDQTVISLQEPADLILDDFQLSSKQNRGDTILESKSKNKVVLKTTGTLRNKQHSEREIPYTLQSTFFNDGVVVSRMTLKPKRDLPIKKILSSRLSATGRFRNYLNKLRNNNGLGSQKGFLPKAGTTLNLTTLSSCLQVFSPEAALAIFTDSAGVHRSQTGMSTAVLNVKEKKEQTANVALQQNIININEGAEPYLIKAGEEFTFRTGISVAPNRLPHPRNSALRMFIWIGDQKHPYPTHQEILDAARLGFTLFQMHRLGTPGEPRPPEGELKRVIQQVHDAGMLFIWCTMADMMPASSDGVKKMQDQNQWKLWQGFNYGGRYKPHMDPLFTMRATCLASPNGLAEYRLKTISDMMNHFEVDGMYLDDNLAYANCNLQKEHGHPHPVYDSLIELHEMNWRRRQLLMEKCPHMVLIDHCTTALVLPVMSAFDVHLYGEGYGSPSLENYWNFFGIVKSLNGQGCIWPGDDENNRTSASIVYNYDLLTGGGQYSYLDWRLYPQKFPYAKGVADDETLYVLTYSRAQSNFGLYESTPYYFAESKKLFSTSTPQTYATIYRNRTWKDYLVPIANMSAKKLKTSLSIHQPEALKLHQSAKYLVFDVNERTSQTVNGKQLSSAIKEIEVPGGSLRLLYLRAITNQNPYHLWGGKRLSESWNDETKSLRFQLDGPPGLQETIFIGNCSHPNLQVTVNGKPAKFHLDSAQGIAFGDVTFSEKPTLVEIKISNHLQSVLPLQKIKPDKLFQHLQQK